MNPDHLPTDKWKKISCILAVCLAVLAFFTYQFYSENLELLSQNDSLRQIRTDLQVQIEEMKGDYQAGVTAGFTARDSYPENGSIIIGTSKDRLAPLTVETDSNSNSAYYVKLVEQSTGLTDLSFFVCPGQTVDIDVPLGDYTVYYATGLHWYDYNDLFGDTTVCYKMDDLFCFYYQDGYYNGYTLSLYNVPDGNLSYQEIDSDLFRSVG